MNPRLKTHRQHRHPGLWSAPDSASKNGIAASVDYLESSTHAGSVLNALQQAAEHDAQDKWITLIGSPQQFGASNTRQVQQWIQDTGINPQRVRWIRVADAQSQAWAAEQALLIDNSMLVIAWLGQCSSRDQKRIQLAAKHTAAVTLLYQQHEFTSPLH